MTKAYRFGAAGLLLALALPLGACESGADPTLMRAGTGAAGGAAVGGLIGAMSGNFGWGALIGAGAGAAGGLLFDYHQREREAQFQRGVQAGQQQQQPPRQ
ncbi:YMGG-like glycine zipper-containing protein [Elioraea sp.]|uniref:YMGG-like glycine zipper-containing protein n=1 Tax=Elioraea sp. TaxID=2185103 RepID=UPI0025BFF8E4|nr:YMGG-like glycine zipper-containing protein [Elioraea sp.]